MKTFVEKYEDTLGLVQEQIKAVDVCLLKDIKRYCNQILSQNEQPTGS